MLENVQKELDLEIRGPDEEDLAFITDSWLKSYAESEVALRLPRSLYYSYHRTVVERILSTERTMPCVKVACLREEPSEILGWCAFYSMAYVLHYVYVKQAYRRLGVAAKLLEHLDIKLISHRTSGMQHLVHMLKNPIYYPHLV
jgi:GNAT superfamily N-acetyltransferase